jgi:hypothetical protein
MATERRGIGVTIGLNAVDPAHYGGWAGPLRNCEADAAAIAQIGRSRGFEMSTLLTPAATRAAVISALERGARELAAGDMFLLSYAGHGGQVRDVDGEDDEDDQQDETWGLHDGLVIDDELNVVFSKFTAGVRVLVLSDSCHSGTVTRKDAKGRAAAARLPPGAVIRGMPGDVSIRTYEQHREHYSAVQRAIPAGVTAQIRATVRLLSACQDHEFAVDGEAHGVFTGALLDVWNDGGFTGTYDEFHRAIVSRVTMQTPNHFVIGAPNPSFAAGPPFTL